MDSENYFAKAERANRRYRTTVIGLLIFLVFVLVLSGAAVFTVSQRNHQESHDLQNTIINNEVKLNQNLSNSIRCILLLTPQTYNPTSVNKCFSISNNLTNTKQIPGR